MLAKIHHFVVGWRRAASCSLILCFWWEKGGRFMALTIYVLNKPFIKIEIARSNKNKQ